MKRMRLFVILLPVCLLLMIQSANSQKSYLMEDASDTMEAFNTVRAAVIGISNYKNLPLEKQLEYAAEDAMSFYRFLLARPDIIKPRNIITFFNEEATNKVRIKTTLYNLIVKESEKNDLVILYFAGHGDVQNFSRRKEEGFLLLHGVSRDGDYMAPGNDVIEISDLQKYISLAPDGVKVLLITDACRSGKLVSSQKAASRVLGALIQDWEDTYKLVSCQPNQLSYENEKWGGGHGVFSYYLLYGMKGLADVNGDKQIQFYELFDFVKQRVQKATDYKQIPKAKGDETVGLFPIDKKMERMARRKFPGKKQDEPDADKKQQYPYLYWGATRSECDYFYNVPPGKQYLVRRFEQLVDQGVLVPGDVNRNKSGIPPLQVEGKKVFRAHDQNAFATDISLDGAVMATGGRDKMVKLWDTKTGKVIDQLAHRGVKSLQFSPDGKHLISGGWDNRLRIWRVKNGELVKSHLAHNNDIQAITFSRNGAYMATGGRGSQVKIWGTRQWKQLHAYALEPGKEIHDLVFSRDGKAFFMACEDGTIVKRGIREGKTLKKVNAGAPVHDLLMMSESDRLLAATASGKVGVYHPEQMTQQTVWDLPLKAINAIESDPKGNYLLAGGIQHQLIIWDLQKHQVAYQTTVPRGISDIALNAFRERAGCVMYGGHGMLLQTKQILPPMSDNAYDTYRLIRSSKGLQHIRGRVRGLYCSALQSYAAQILRPFINGKALLPGLDKIQKAQTYLHYASRIYEGEDVISRRIKIKQKLLSIFETLTARRYDNLPQAAAKVKDIIEKQPDAAYTHNTLSVIYRRLNELQKAKQSGKTAARRIPQWTEPKANLGLAYFNEGHYDQAIKEFNKIIDLRPDLAKGYLHLAGVYAFLGDFDHARGLYRKAQKRDSINPAVYQGRARLKMRTGDENRAEKLLRLSLDHHPGYTANRRLLARLYHLRFLKYYHHKGKVREDLLQQAQTILKDLNKSYYRKLQLAEMYLTIYSLKNEISNLQSKRLLDVFKPEDFHAFRYQAYQWLQAIKPYDPLNTRINLGIARCKSLNGNQQEALAYLKKFSASLPNNPRPLFAMGRICQQQGEWGNARNYYQQAISLDKRYLPAYYMMLVSLKTEKKKSSKVSQWLDSLTGKGDVSREEFLGKARENFQSSIFQDLSVLDKYYMVRFF